MADGIEEGWVDIECFEELMFRRLDNRCLFGFWDYTRLAQFMVRITLRLKKPLRTS